MDFFLEVIIACIWHTSPFSCACRSAVCSAIWCLSSCQWSCTLWKRPWASFQHPAVPARVSPRLPQLHSQHLVLVRRAAAALALGCPSAPGLPEYVWCALICFDLIWWGLGRAQSTVKRAKFSFYHRTTAGITNTVIGELLSWGAGDLFCLLPSSPLAPGWPLCQKLSLLPVIIEL